MSFLPFRRERRLQLHHANVVEEVEPVVVLVDRHGFDEGLRFLRLVLQVVHARHHLQEVGLVLLAANGRSQNVALNCRVS